MISLATCVPSINRAGIVPPGPIVPSQLGVAVVVRGVPSARGRPGPGRIRVTRAASPPRTHAGTLRRGCRRARRRCGLREDDAVAPSRCRQCREPAWYRRLDHVQSGRREDLASRPAIGTRTHGRPHPGRHRCAAGRVVRCARRERICSDVHRSRRRAPRTAGVAGRASAAAISWVVRPRTHTSSCRPANRCAGWPGGRVHQQVIEIGEGALRFTNAELASIGPLQDERGRSVDLGGWPALVRLATAFGPSAAARVRRARKSSDALDVDRRRALAAIVAIGGGSRELCAAVAQLVLDRPVVLDELIAGLPLIWSDDATVEPHGLWTPLLDGVLTKDERRAVGAHAAAACRAAGDSSRGFELSVAVDDVEGVRASIRTACSRGYAALPRDVLADWQDRLPDALRSEPEGLLLAGIAERARDPFGEQRTRSAGPSASRLPAAGRRGHRDRDELRVRLRAAGPGRAGSRRTRDRASIRTRSRGARRRARHVSARTRDHRRDLRGRRDRARGDRSHRRRRDLARVAGRRRLPR